MKKKSLLILPVLLLALAACNKEEEVEEPEDDDTVTTEPSGDQEPGGDGGTTEGGEKEEDKIDSRIELATGSVEGVSFENPTDLAIVSTTADDEGNVTYVLGGTAGVMVDAQATAFWSGVAKAGDKYFSASILLNEGETISWTASDGQEKTGEDEDYAKGSLDVVTRISGDQVSVDKLLTGKTTYTITDSAAGTSVNHTVDFSALIDTIKISLSTESIAEGNNGTLDVPFENPSDLVIASVEESTGECGNTVYTYHLAGTAGEMTEVQAEDFWKDHAAKGDLYIIITVSFAADETVSWVSSAGDTRTRTVSDYEDCEFDVVIRISGKDLNTEIGGGSVTYTITDGESNSVSHVIDFSALLPDTSEE